MNRFSNYPGLFFHKFSTDHFTSISIGDQKDERVAVSDIKKECTSLHCFAALFRGKSISETSCGLEVSMYFLKRAGNISL